MWRSLTRLRSLEVVGSKWKEGVRMVASRDHERRAELMNCHSGQNSECGDVDDRFGIVLRQLDTDFP